MKKTVGKILILMIFGFSGVLLFVPNVTFASDGAWHELNWGSTQKQASGMGYLHHWLSGLQSKAHKNTDCDHSRDDNRKCNCDNHRHVQGKNYSNNINVSQRQKVTGDFVSVKMEQSTRVYVNGQLTTSEQQLSVARKGDRAEQTQEVSVNGF